MTVAAVAVEVEAELAAEAALVFVVVFTLLIDIVVPSKKTIHAACVGETALPPAKISASIPNSARIAFSASNTRLQST